jgi:guanylate kinase
MFKEVNPYNVFIIEGPSGVEKSTMMEELLVRLVTRPPQSTGTGI